MVSAIFVLNSALSEADKLPTSSFFFRVSNEVPSNLSDGTEVHRLAFIERASSTSNLPKAYPIMTHGYTLSEHLDGIFRLARDLTSSIPTRENIATAPSAARSASHMSGQFSEYQSKLKALAYAEAGSVVNGEWTSDGSAPVSFVQLPSPPGETPTGPLSRSEDSQVAMALGHGASRVEDDEPEDQPRQLAPVPLLEADDITAGRRRYGVSASAEISHVDDPAAAENSDIDWEAWNMVFDESLTSMQGSSMDAKDKETAA